MKKKTIEIPLLHRAKWEEEDPEDYHEQYEAMRKQTMMFLQAYADHVTEGNPALGLMNFISHVSQVWNSNIQYYIYGVCLDPWEYLTEQEHCKHCGAKGEKPEKLGYTHSDLENGSTREAIAFKSSAKKLLQESRYEKVVQIKPEIKIKDMS